MPRDTQLSPLSPPASTSLTSVSPEVLLPGPDAADSDVPEHLQVLFLTTLQEANLSPTLTSNFKDLLIRNQDAFAKSPTSGFVTSWSTTSTQRMRLLYGNHLVDPL